MGNQAIFFALNQPKNPLHPVLSLVRLLILHLYEKNQLASDVADRIYFQVAERRSNSLVLEKDDSGKLIQNDIGGLTIVGSDNTINQAEKIAEDEISKITGPLFHRKDIGTSKLIRKRINQMKEIR